MVFSQLIQVSVIRFVSASVDIFTFVSIVSSDLNLILTATSESGSNVKQTVKSAFLSSKITVFE